MARRPVAVVVEADGGSRGNPGPAAYGAVLRDAETGTVIAERGERIGVATNNVAEYRGLIAGLELYREYAEGADLEVRLDSKLVVEQMSGNWKIKHPDMKPLAIEANRLAPFGTRFVWVPRARNAHADRLANEALDSPEGTIVGGPGPVVDDEDTPATAVASAATRPEAPRAPWEQGPPTTLVLVRHGVTAHTVARRFAGRAGADPELAEDGHAQVRAAAEWLAPLRDRDPVLLSSPMRRTRESAEILSATLAAPVVIDDGLVEASFGSWEGLTYGEVRERDPETFARWMRDVHQAAGGDGDSLADFDARMRRTGARLLEAYQGRTVVAASHLTPIKLLVRQALDLPLESVYRIEVAPASTTVIAWYPDGRPVLRLLNGMPTGDYHSG